MKYLITGGCGFIGSNLAKHLLENEHEVHIFDNLGRVGTSLNLKWLQEIKSEFKIKHIHGDIRNINDIQTAVENVKPDFIFHFAGQVAMTTSLENPRHDFETNVIGAFNLLESIRLNSPESVILYSSTNKVYGDLEYINYTEIDSRYNIDHPDYSKYGFDENVKLDFRSPYGCSKGAADQYILDYTRNFNLRAIVFRHSSIFGERQLSNFDQGWIGWFIRQAILTKQDKLREPFTICGNGKQVRDILFVPDLISCYIKACDNLDKCNGEVFNIGGGKKNSLSIIELFNILEPSLDTELKYTKLPCRSNDQKVFIADIRKAKNVFNWEPTIDKISGIENMINWVKSYEQL